MKLLVSILCLLTFYSNCTQVYTVILAGGSGERLWPLTRKEKPKQLLCIDEKKTLLEQTIERMQLIPENHIWISTTKQYHDQIEEIVGSQVESIIIEPSKKDTAPAILYACFKLYDADPDAIVMFVPSDAYIPVTQYQKFSNYLQKGVTFAKNNECLLLFGLKPTYPATGYGYIEFEPVGNGPCKVTKFREKPSEEVAQKYLEQDNKLWNMCMFCGKVSVFLQEFEQHAPDIFKQVKDAQEEPDCFNKVKPDSIDYAVMEKSDNVWVLPVDYAWTDVGNLAVFLSLKNIFPGNYLSVDAHDNLVDSTKEIVALIGVHDLCIVETNDALLITKKSEAEKVRSIVKQLKQKKKYEELL